MSDWHQVDDIHLLKDAQEGNTEAFGQIYERYAARVFRYFFAHLDNRLDAEDLTEEVFLRAWRSLPAYREQGVPFLSFIFRIARNALIDHYRRDQSSKQKDVLEEVNLPDQKPGPGEIAIASLEHSELIKALKGLRDDYRMVLVLRFFGELSPEETAQVMGRSAGAIRVLQYRALKALRTRLEHLQGE